MNKKIYQITPGQGTIAPQHEIECELTFKSNSQMPIDQQKLLCLEIGKNKHKNYNYPFACPKNIDTICCDGQEYDNACLAECDGFKDAVTNSLCKSGIIFIMFLYLIYSNLKSYFVRNKNDLNCCNLI